MNGWKNLSWNLRILHLDLVSFYLKKKKKKEENQYLK